MREIAIVAAVIAAAAGPGGPARAGDDRVDRGAYLATIMGCGDCHTRGAMLGRPDPALALAGSEVGFLVPGQGVFYGPNLTGDAETGLGRWSEGDIVAALRTGVRPDGRMLAPIMPWPNYAVLRDDDAAALAAYLKSLPAVPYPDEPQPVGDPALATAPYLTLAGPAPR